MPIRTHRKLFLKTEIPVEVQSLQSPALHEPLIQEEIFINFIVRVRACPHKGQKSSQHWSHRQLWSRLSPEPSLQPLKGMGYKSRINAFQQPPIIQLAKIKSLVFPS